MKICIILKTAVILIVMIFAMNGCGSGTTFIIDNNDSNVSDDNGTIPGDDSNVSDDNETIPGDIGTVRYAGIYFNYRNTVHEMQILVETDVGVDDNIVHRQIHFEHSSDCNEPNWEWRHYDYDFWPTFGQNDHSGIPNKQNRRLWAINVRNLTADCLYDVRFKYRDYDAVISDNWEETWGHFHATPSTNKNDASILPSWQEFYALGDTRITTNNSSADDVNDVFGAMWSHPGKKTFLLHTGDIVWNGGSPVGYYRYRELKDGVCCDHDIPYPRNNDSWYKNFLGHHDNIANVWEVLRHMPMFPVVGNHDIQVNAYEGHYYDYSNGAFIDSIYPNAYNYTRYFGGYSNENKKSVKDQYWFRAYGPLLIWGLTAYDGLFQDPFCLDKNKNFRPKEEGGTGQYEWLEASLKEHAGDIRQWKVVMLHTPIYDPDDGCSNQTDARTYLKPLFEKYGVDLVLTGHEHFYARKKVNDINYLILGGGGAGLGLSQKCQDDEQCNGFELVKNKHHFGYFRIMGDKMECSIIGKDKVRFDSFVINREPKAHFDAIPAEGSIPPLTMKFSDTSTGNRYKYKWDFDDGHTSEGLGMDASTEHTFSAKGIYAVQLTITSAIDSNTTTNHIYVGSDDSRF